MFEVPHDLIKILKSQSKKRTSIDPPNKQLLTYASNVLKLPHQTTVHPRLQLLCQDLLKLLGSPKTPGGWDVCPLFLGSNTQHPQKQGLFQPKQGSVGFQVWMDGWMDVKSMVLHPSLAPPQTIFGVFFSERIFFIETIHPFEPASASLDRSSHPL